MSRARRGLLFLILPAFLSPAVVDRIAATVNDVAIPESELRKAMVVSALSPQPGEEREAFRARVLDALIDQHLQYEDARRFGPPPPDAAETSEALRQLREKLAGEGKDPEAEFARAGLTPEEVRASVERQLLIQRYLKERFTPIAFADEERAREDYEKRYVPERQKAGLEVLPFESVSEEMRRRSQARVFEEEVEKWMKDLRRRARVAIYRIPVPVPEGRRPVLLSTPLPRPTPGP